MNETERGRIEERLLEEREDALATIDEETRVRLGLDDSDLSNYKQHAADEGTDTMEQEKHFLLASTEGRRLNDIDEALRRLYKKPDEFGRCAVCGREISDERLDLLPWTTTCAEHADQDEGASSEN